MKLVRVLAAAAMLSAAAPALADPPAPPTVSGHLNVLPQQSDPLYIAPALTDFGSITYGGSTVTVGNSPGVYISLVAGTAYSTQSNATLDYDFVIYVPETGSEPTDIADIADISGTYSLTTSMFDYGSVSINAGGNGFPPPPGTSFSHAGTGQNLPSGAFAIKGSGTLFGTGILKNGVLSAAYAGHVTLSAQLSVYHGPGAAFIDPLITPNLMALQNAGFFGTPVIELSPGVPNALVGNIPEPAQWALLIGGFGMIGGAARRRRVAVAA